MSTKLATLMILTLFFTQTQAGEFKLTVKAPVMLSKHFSEGIDHLNIIPGKDKTDYSKEISIRTFKVNKSGCGRYAEDFHNLKNEEVGILLVDNDSCSLSTKIHYAQLAGASSLFLKYLDENIEEAEIDKSSFEGVRIPVFMLRSNDAKYIYDVLNADKDASHLVVTMQHKTMIDLSNKKIQVFMSSQMINNSMVVFLKDLLEHGRLIKDYDISVKFSIGFCKSCQEKQYLRQEPSCLSGGRYCVINSDFKSNELVKETLRQICIRDIYGVPTLVNYLSSLKIETEELYFGQNFKEKEMQGLSKNSMVKNSVSDALVETCVQSSYIKLQDQETVDPNLDDNKLLQKEQVDFFSITKYNIFPLVIVNGVYYDRSINVREFIRFGCENRMFDCRGFRIFKKLFLGIIVVISLLLVSVVIMFCRKVMKRKMDSEINIKVNEAIQKYLTVEKA